jgi:Fe-S cluster biosynthesis and repair protein YggX
METITCGRCGRDDAPALLKAPFKTELGERIKNEICADCWQEWLRKQTQIINHYGLDPRDAEARQFLFKQTEEALFGGGRSAEIDTSKEGTVEW